LKNQEKRIKKQDFGLGSWLPALESKKMTDQIKAYRAAQKAHE
jgi:hypothetical protein